MSSRQLSRQRLEGIKSSLRRRRGGTEQRIHHFRDGESDTHPLGGGGRLFYQRSGRTFRTAEDDGDFYIDLADKNWRTVRISPEGCEILESAPVRFSCNNKVRCEASFVPRKAKVASRRFCLFRNFRLFWEIGGIGGLSHPLASQKRGIAEKKVIKE